MAERGFGTRERSSNWTAPTRPASDPELNWSSATWKSSSKPALVSGAATATSSVFASGTGRVSWSGLGLEYDWWDMGELERGNRHCVKLWEVFEEEEEEDSSGGRCDAGGGGGGGA